MRDAAHWCDFNRTWCDFGRTACQMKDPEAGGPGCKGTSRSRYPLFAFWEQRKRVFLYFCCILLQFWCQQVLLSYVLLSEICEIGCRRWLETRLVSRQISRMWKKLLKKPYSCPCLLRRQSCYKNFLKNVFCDLNMCSWVYQDLAQVPRSRLGLGSGSRGDKDSFRRQSKSEETEMRNLCAPRLVRPALFFSNRGA